MSGITHSWNGTVLTVTSDSGTSSADLKGDTGIRGPQGSAGAVMIDPALTQGGYAADAKVTGDYLDRVIIKNVSTKGTSCDDYKEQGVYYITSANYAPTGLPNSAVNGWLIVLTQTESSIKDGVLRFYKQIFMRSGTVNNTDKDFYYRCGKITVDNVESWGDWYKVIHNKDMERKTLTVTKPEQTAYTVNSLDVFTRNGITDIYLDITVNTSSTSWVTIGSITTGKPDRNTYRLMPHSEALEGYKSLKLRVYPTGVIQLSVGEPNQRYIFHETYINAE